MNLGKKFRTMCCGEGEDICVHFDKVAHLHEELGKDADARQPRVTRGRGERERARGRGLQRAH